MKAKNTLAFVGILSLLVAGFFIVNAQVGGVSISITQNMPNPVTPGSSHDVKVLLTNNNGSNLLVEWLNIPDTTRGTTWISLPSNSTISDNSSKEYTATLSIPSNFEDTFSRILRANIYKINPVTPNSYTFIGTIDQSFTVNFTAPPKNFCSNGNQGPLKLSDIDISNLGEGKDEEWWPLDEIEIIVDVENTDRNDDVDDVLVEVMIEDNNGVDVTSDFDFDKEEIDLGRIREDDTETATFKIKEVPADLDEGNYKLFIKAFSDGDEENHCAGEFNKKTFQEIEFRREEDKAVIVRSDDLVNNRVQASCGDQGVRVSIPIYNIGDEKEKKVLINLFNNELNIDEYEVVSNLRSGKRKEISFLMDIPESLSKTKYDLEIITYFDYDEDGNEKDVFSYDANSNEDLSEDYLLPLQIISCKGKQPSIDANLDPSSMTKVGEDLLIRATITNNGDDSTFTFSATEYDSWAELISVSPQTAEIKKGATADVIIKLVPKKGGLQTFRINSLTGGELTSRSVSVNIESVEENKPLFGDISGLTNYLMIAIAIILVLIFLILIIRVSRRPVKPEF